MYGHLLVSSSLDSSVRLWSVYPNKGEVLNLKHTQGVKDVRWSVDGHTLFSGGLDSYVNVIDAEKGVCSHSYKHTEYYIGLRDYEQMGYKFMFTSYKSISFSFRWSSKGNCLLGYSCQQCCL